jgi:hypothetical protein
MFPAPYKITIDINLTLVVYKSFLLSISTYAYPLWGHAIITYINKLLIFQIKFHRIITELPRVI